MQCYSFLKVDFASGNLAEPLRRTLISFLQPFEEG
jgi:hypothetical protein